RSGPVNKDRKNRGAYLVYRSKLRLQGLDVDCSDFKIVVISIVIAGIFYNHRNLYLITVIRYYLKIILRKK
ncbi:MAG: hypothetical protein Q8O30_09670, partial [Candidatus Omnitrophota bacterium]|nr:hypothetical protein [Candidatus Omnitrophota bacterium]